jgi:hypothetical protein
MMLKQPSLPAIVVTHTPPSQQLLNITKAALDHAEAEAERLRDALRAIIAYYDEHGVRSKGMDMILADCRKLLEETR